MVASYKIGDLARLGDTPIETIRYYEREGLLARPARTTGNYRIYDESHRRSLTFIRQCRLLDMSLEEIKSLLGFRDNQQGNCEEVTTLLDEHIQHVSERVAELGRLKRDLMSLRRRCRSNENNCAILTELSEGKATRSKRTSPSLRRSHPR